MNQVRAICTNRGGNLQRFRNAQVRRMLGAEERVDDEDAGTAQDLDRGRRNALRIGYVRQRANAIGEDGDRSVWNGDGDDFDVANGEGFPGFDNARVALWLGRPRDRTSVVEDVCELATQTLQRFHGAVHRERTVAPHGKSAEVVDPVGVVGVIVREEHGVDPVHAGSDELESQLRRRVDEYSRTSVRFDEGAHPGALVSRIG
jgi:hypothetical protein